MEKLQLLLSENLLAYRTVDSRGVTTAEKSFVDVPEEPLALEAPLTGLLQNKFSEAEIVSAYPYFSVVPAGFSQHDCADALIHLNSDAAGQALEPMLSVNLHYGVQFYYGMPLPYYRQIKQCAEKTAFNFSGEKFLSRVQPKSKREIHILLHPAQCEFLALENKKLLLYNNLGVQSEVDFLYFIMFTVSKLGFGTQDTLFLVYGETHQHETFISELQKFVRQLKIVYDNLPGRHFLF